MCGMYTGGASHQSTVTNNTQMKKERAERERRQAWAVLLRNFKGERLNGSKGGQGKEQQEGLALSHAWERTRQSKRRTKTNERNGWLCTHADGNRNLNFCGAVSISTLECDTDDMGRHPTGPCRLWIGHRCMRADVGWRSPSPISGAYALGPPTVSQKWIFLGEVRPPLTYGERHEAAPVRGDLGLLALGRGPCDPETALWRSDGRVDPFRSTGRRD